MKARAEQAGERRSKDPLPRRGLREELRRPLQEKRLALFLDYDGTLTPIVETPQDAKMKGSMRAVVKELTSLCPVAIVSGRDREDVENLVQLDEVIYAGSHGFDIAGPGKLRMEQEGGLSCQPLLEDTETELQERIGDLYGIKIERKRHAIAVHFRNVSVEDVPRVKKVVEEIGGRYDRLRLARGKKVIELQPRIDWDKGKAVLWLLKALGLDSPDVCPIYIGDDVTDEDAFRALAGRGFGFVVGELDRKTAADYRLRDVREVEDLLREILKARIGSVTKARARQSGSFGPRARASKK